MNNKIPDPAKPIGEVTIVKDFLPPPEQLVAKKISILVKCRTKVKNLIRCIDQNILSVYPMHRR